MFLDQNDPQVAVEMKLASIGKISGMQVANLLLYFDCYEEKTKPLAAVLNHLLKHRFLW